MPEVTFSNGVTLEMCYPPPFPLNEDLKRLDKYKVSPTDSNEVGIEKQLALNEAMERYALKAAFRNLIVPDGWEFPAAALSEGLTPSEGEQGRLLDYVRHEFIAMPADVGKVNAIILYSAPVTSEEVGALRQLFQRVRRFFVWGHHSAAIQSV